MAINEIIINKARVHNLDNVSIKIPKNTLTVITGPSGSGKSSLAFDTIYVEGQRRYIESLSSYARQFLGQYQPPDVDSIDGLSPAIAIDQKTTSKNPRSTVGTTTEVYDYLRILFARIGTLYCPETGIEIKRFSATRVVKELLKYEDRTKLQLLAPVECTKSEISKFLSMGFSRARMNQAPILIEDIDKDYTGPLEIVIDRIVIKEGIEKRLTDSVEYALKIGEGSLIALINEEEVFYSEKNISPKTKKVYPDLEPRLFSFNSPIGACPECNGLGETKVFDKSLMILDESLSILDGAVTPIAKKNSFFYKMFIDVAKTEGIDLTTRFKDLPKEFIETLFHGTDKVYKYSFKSQNSNFEFQKPFKGIIRWLTKKFRETTSEKTRKELEKFMNIKCCPTCNGDRLNQIALSTTINGKNIIDLSNLPVEKLHSYFKELELDGEKKLIAEKLLKEIRNRIKFLIDVGLGYLNLNRAAMTLSGGESQRIRLATQIGSALTGVLYVLDEPSIGLHHRDNSKLVKTLSSLRDLGNTVLVVEHEEETMMSADYLVDMGPGAGIHGGKVIAHGPLKDVLNHKKSLTAKYLNKSKFIKIPKTRRAAKKFISLKGAAENNLQNVNVDIPLGILTSITGVSGSGKSTLVHEILVPAVRAYLSGSSNRILYEKSNYQSISGVSEINTVIELDQSPIGRTPHSNPATYSGMFDEIRAIFAKTTESKVRGYKPGRFSFNVKGGRCEECEGNGVKKIEMHFLPDVYVTCTECSGTRYNKETLSILYRGKNIADVLQMSIEEALEFFANHPKLFRILSTLNDVGLGYMKLGQPATTLSGGEAQRLKLSRELAKRTKGHCLYVLDEPTTGLHFKDIDILLGAINGLLEKGHSVVIIEHNPDVIKTSDYIIDLGPEGGDKGGEIIATGTPEEVAKIKKSHTGKFLARLLDEKN